MYRPSDKTTTASEVTVRLAEDADALALVKLAALDSAEVPPRPALVAVRDGETVAALPVNGGSAIADPFRHTAAIVELLELRAAQLRGEGHAASPTVAARVRSFVRRPQAVSLR